MKPLDKLRTFKLETPIQHVALLKNIQKLIANDEIKNVIKNHRHTSGIYYWTLLIDSAEYIIYIGKTKSISNRLNNYIRNFQPHSTNDYKLKVFLSYILSICPKATMNLYFENCDPDSLTKTENLRINAFNFPILNRPHVDTPARQMRLSDLQEAFTRYYIQQFTDNLAQNT
jgi:hypothetical protein